MGRRGGHAHRTGQLLADQLGRPHRHRIGQMPHVADRRLPAGDQPVAQHQRAEHRHQRQEPEEGHARRQHADIVFRLLAPGAAQMVSRCLPAAATAKRDERAASPPACRNGVYAGHRTYRHWQARFRTFGLAEMPRARALFRSGYPGNPKLPARSSLGKRPRLPSVRILGGGSASSSPFVRSATTRDYGGYRVIWLRGRRAIKPPDRRMLAACSRFSLLGPHRAAGGAASASSGSSAYVSCGSAHGRSFFALPSFVGKC